MFDSLFGEPPRLLLGGVRRVIGVDLGPMVASMSETNDKAWTEMTLREELAASIKEHEKLATVSFRWADALLLTSVVTSVAAGVLVGLSSGVIWLKEHAWVSAIVASLPALCLSLERSFKWSNRSDWHFNYFLRMLAIFRRIRDEELSEAEASRELTELDLKMNDAFPGRHYPSGDVAGARKGRSAV